MDWIGVRTRSRSDIRHVGANGASEVHAREVSKEREKKRSRRANTYEITLLALLGRDQSPDECNKAAPVMQKNP